MAGEGSASAGEAWFVARTLRALELISFEPLSAPRVGALLDIHPRTARRLLNRLVDEGYAVRTPDARRQYTASMRLVALAGQIVDRAALTRTATPFVHGLAQVTDATAELAIPSYRSVLSVVRSDGGRGFGELAPSHCTAAGKALLAFRDPWRESVLGAPLAAYTARTVTDPDAVRAEAAATRERGYALEVGERREDLVGAAAPVFGSDGAALAALSATTSSARAVAELVADVVATAAALTGALRG